MSTSILSVNLQYSTKYYHQWSTTAFFNRGFTMPGILPKCRSFTFSQEYFVFNQQNLKFIV